MTLGMAVMLTCASGFLLRVFFVIVCRWEGEADLFLTYTEVSFLARLSSPDEVVPS